MVKFHRGTDVAWVGVIPPDSSVQEVEPVSANGTGDDATTFEVHYLVMIVLPFEAIVWTNTHCVHQSNRASQ